MVVSKLHGHMSEFNLSNWRFCWKTTTKVSKHDYGMLQLVIIVDQLPNPQNATRDHGDGTTVVTLRTGGK